MKRPCGLDAPIYREILAALHILSVSTFDNVLWLHHDILRSTAVTTARRLRSVHSVVRLDTFVICLLTVCYCVSVHRIQRVAFALCPTPLFASILPYPDRSMPLPCRQYTLAILLSVPSVWHGSPSFGFALFVGEGVMFSLLYNYRLTDYASVICWTRFVVAAWWILVLTVLPTPHCPRQSVDNAYPVRTFNNQSSNVVLLMLRAPAPARRVDAYIRQRYAFLFHYQRHVTPCSHTAC